MRDEFLTRFHALVEVQAEPPPLKAVQEEPSTMNPATELNVQLLNLIQDLWQQVTTLVTNNNRTIPLIPKNTCKPPNAPNLWKSMSL